MEFEKLVSPSLKDLFITHIEAMILSGELPVGQQLPPERQLALSMGVSRAVVNSGVAELERRGFLEVRPRVGTFVTDYRRAGTLDTLKSIMTYNRGRLRNEEIRSILEIRDALDKLAAAGIIACASEEDIAALFRAAEAIREAGDNRHAAEAAFAFQHELAMQSGNTLLPLIFRSFYSSVLVLWERFCALNGVSMLYETACAATSGTGTFSPPWPGSTTAPGRPSPAAAGYTTDPGAAKPMSQKEITILRDGDFFL